MATWSGWENQFLQRAGIIETPPNRTFLGAWAQHAPGSCKNNPVDLSTAVRGSTRCGATVAGFGRSQNYGTHAQAAHAFQIQVDTSWVQPLKAALNTGNPFQIGDRTAVIAVLKRWGSQQFATWYENATTAGGGGGSGGGSTTGQSAHKGWNQIRRSVNHRMPHAINASEHNIRAALRSLGHAHKVKG